MDAPLLPGSPYSPVVIVMASRLLSIEVLEAIRNLELACDTAGIFRQSIDLPVASSPNDGLVLSSPAPTPPTFPNEGEYINFEMIIVILSRNHDQPATAVRKFCYKLVEYMLSMENSIEIWDPACKQLHKVCIEAHHDFKLNREDWPEQRPRPIASSWIFTTSSLLALDPTAFISRRSPKAATRLGELVAGLRQAS